MQVDPAIWHSWDPKKKAAHEARFYRGPEKKRGKKEKVISTSKDGTYRCPDRPKVARKKGMRKRLRAHRTTTIRSTGGTQ